MLPLAFWPPFPFSAFKGKKIATDEVAVGEDVVAWLVVGVLGIKRMGEGEQL